MIPYIAGFDQLSYVTNDMGRAVELFADYGLPRFQVEDISFPATFFGEPGSVELTVAFANVGPTQVELIEPRGGSCKIYTDLLPTDGSFGMKLHHLRIRVDGDRTDWERTRNEIQSGARPVALAAEFRKLAFLYADDRATFGHYTEYVWFDPAEQNARDQRIPQYENRR